MSNTDTLRRMVLSERDGFSEPIRTLLEVLGYGVSWAKVDGSRLSCFIGGDGKPPIPDVGERLKGDIGGSTQNEWSPGDSYWVWHWTAPIT